MGSRPAPPATPIFPIRWKSRRSSPTSSSTTPPSSPPCCTTRSRTPAATLEEIDRLFGPQIGKLVDGLTKIKKLDLVSKRAAQGENFRKLLLAVAEDVRVLLVKLADRLHNMRTLHFVPPEKRARIAQETLDIYAPLAGRMGMQRLREELEELAFRHLTPEAYQAIESRAARSAREKRPHHRARSRRS